MSWKNRAIKILNGCCFAGLVLATLFFAISVSPSLLPRTVLFQGLLSGFSLAIGYSLGVALTWLWRHLELPALSDRNLRIAKTAATAFASGMALYFLWSMTFWQNSIRELMNMPSTESAYPWSVAIIALASGALLIIVGRWLQFLFAFVSRKLNLFLPPRVANVASALIIGYLLITVSNGVFAKQALRIADNFFLKTDGMIDDGVQRPTNNLATGSEHSIIAWHTIGRRGKNFLVGGPDMAKISDVNKRPAIQPLRVYAGLRSAKTIEQRARLALDELKRVRAFERSVLVIATPTGTGWLDENAVDTLEYLHAGDTAIVTMQYSYLPSWITILVDPETAQQSAKALFNEVYDHWKTLPVEERPKLYLHGLSLGSFGSEVSADLMTTFEDPIQGAVWSGPPFPSRSWASISAARETDSPAWLPKFRDGSIIRFTAQANSIDDAGDRWGPIRIVYVQYASDPMVFFSTDLLWQKPAWLVGERGPDVSPFLKWYPVVTFLQVAFDLPLATSVPNGFGHNYSASSYIDAWLAVTQPPNWNDKQTARLKTLFATPAISP